MTHGITELQDAAAAKVAALLAMPLPVTHEMLGIEGEFFPWELFPAIYGSYSSDFDDLAIAVLCDLRDQTYLSKGLATEMFREMLCVLDLCDYGSSPRVCFPTEQFRALLPDLIEKWMQYRCIAWGLQSISS